ncbi:MAG TPA: hypothetical protein VHE12_04015 [bacterium]|nr:hypothetical protein [bacterium]
MKNLGLNYILIIVAWNICGVVNSQEGRNQTNLSLNANEKKEKIIDDHIYLVKKEKKIETSRIYFVDDHNKVFSTFQIFPSSPIKDPDYKILHSEKYITIRRIYSKDSRTIVDGTVLDLKGATKWKVPPELFVIGYFADIIPNDENNTIMIINALKGTLKIFSVNGKEKTEKQFSPQAPSEHSTLDDEEDSEIEFSSQPSEKCKYVCISRESSETNDFKNEITLLDGNGDILFQKFDEQSRFKSVLGVFEDFKMIVIKGDSGRGRRKTRQFERYFGLDFNGNKLWELDAEKYYFDLSDRYGTIVPLDYVYKEMDKNGKHCIRVENKPSRQKLDLITGKIF